MVQFAVRDVPGHRRKLCQRREEPAGQNAGGNGHNRQGGECDHSQDPSDLERAGIEFGQLEALND